MGATEEPEVERPEWVETTVAEFLGLAPHEAAIVEVRHRIALGIRQARETSGISRAAIAKATGTTQGRVALCESGSPAVTIELMLHALYAAGSSLTEIGFPGPPGEAEERERRKAKSAAALARAVKRARSARTKTA